MASTFIDIHPHIISDDVDRYPHAPVFGLRSEWSKERPATLAQLQEEMDEAGVTKAAIVQSSTTYGFDNSYVVEAVAGDPNLIAVGNVDMLLPDGPEKIEEWVKRGLAGLRLFTGGTTKAFDPSELDDPRSFPSWEKASELGLSMCIQTGPIGLPQVTGLAKRFPKVNIILDHMGRPDFTDGPPYANAASLFELAPLENIYLKLTPRIFGGPDLKGGATAETLFPKLVSVFGASRMAWGSNFPASAGKMSDNLRTAQECLATLSDEDRAWIFARTAQKLYPSLAD
jgi:L-fuconolactonase